jgi:hypothetical protein
MLHILLCFSYIFTAITEFLKLMTLFPLVMSKAFIYYQVHESFCDISNVSGTLDLQLLPPPDCTVILLICGIAYSSYL